jgi:hypothetical protein
MGSNEEMSKTLPSGTIKADPESFLRHGHDRHDLNDEARLRRDNDFDNKDREGTVDAREVRAGLGRTASSSVASTPVRCSLSVAERVAFRF